MTTLSLEILPSKLSSSHSHTHTYSRKTWTAKTNNLKLFFAATIPSNEVSSAHEFLYAESDMLILQSRVADIVMTGPGAIISDPCAGHECRKGSQCVPSPIGNGYTCRCQTGWQGRYCEKGRRFTREFFFLFFFFFSLENFQFRQNEHRERVRSETKPKRREKRKKKELDVNWRLLLQHRRVAKSTPESITARTDVGVDDQ